MQNRRWDDLRFPSQGINPPGAASDPTVNTSTGLLQFSGTVDNVLAGAAQMPHAWKYGSEMHFHVHLLFPTSANANTRWKLEYNRVPLAGNADHAHGTYTALTVITIANPQDVTKHVIGEFDPISMTGMLGSTCVLWRLSRLANSDGADTDTNLCVLMELDIHYEIDKMGSPTEIPA